MKLIYSLGILLLIFFPSITQAQKEVKITVSNPVNINRPDELVVFKRADLEKKLGAIPKFIQIISKGIELVVQHDDLNGDGKWDEAVLLYSFHPMQKVTLTVSTANSTNSGEAIQKAHVRLRKKNTDNSWGPNIAKEEMPLKNPATDFSKQPLPLYLTEGPSWENDKVGFRLYFDVRNGKDIWGKCTPRMVLDSVGTKVEPTYHDLHDWGMDVLHVGKSLGAGALALLVPQPNGKDTLLRVGGDAIVKTNYKQVADGPVRAIFEIDYDIKINNKPIFLSEQTTIWGGQYFYESRVFVNGTPANAKLVTGIASFYGNVFRSFSNGNCNVLLSHGKQSENKDYLGMALLVPNKEASFLGSSPIENSDILNTYIAAMDVKKGQACVFRFYAAWEKTDSRFAWINFFSDMLSTETKKIDHPIQIIF